MRNLCHDTSLRAPAPAAADEKTGVVGDTITKILVGLGGAAVVFFVIIFAPTFLYAKVLMDCWDWFVTPQFGLARLGFWEALGLFTVWNCFSARIPTKSPPNDHGIWTKLGMMVFGACSIWATAFLYHQLLTGAWRI